MRTITILTFLFFSIGSFSVHASFEKGTKLKELKLEGEKGGHLDGKAWSSNSMLGKIAVLYYVDPDEKDKNEALSQALKKRDFPEEHVRYHALINMDATWLPNFAIASSLKSKQEKYPTTVYLKDYEKLGVKEWGLADDENNVVVFDAKGRVIFSKFGKLSSEEIQEMISLIEEEIKKNQKAES